MFCIQFAGDLWSKKIIRKHIDVPYIVAIKFGDENLI